MRFLTSLAVTAVVSAVAFAADPLGTASSSTAFGLNGVSMRSDGVSSWPVMSGDEISSGGAPVMIRFQDGSRVTLGEQSRAKLTDTGNGLTLNVTAGEAQFNLAQPS